MNLPGFALITSINSRTSFAGKDVLPMRKKFTVAIREIAAKSFIGLIDGLLYMAGLMPSVVLVAMSRV